MKLKYINKIKANISIYSSKKTTNLLEGTYKSVYKGKSLNFENLREYTYNDDVKDIDWKASSRSGNLLVKQYIAEKKHNIMIVTDTGIKMTADTDLNENKKELALYTAGTIGYLAIQNGDYISLTYSKNSQIEYRPFKYNLYNLEEYLTELDSLENKESELSINDTLKYIFKNVTKKMIIFVITDIAGLDNLELSTIKKITQVHDLMLININDHYLNGQDIYDVNNQKYIPSLFLNDTKLEQIEKDFRNDLLTKWQSNLKKQQVSLVSISSKAQINNKIIELLEEHRNASNNSIK